MQFRAMTMRRVKQVQRPSRRPDKPHMAPFLWSEFHSQARTRLLTGLVLLVIGLGYGSWAALRFGIRGSDAVGFDRPIVDAARSLVPAPVVTQTMRPTNNRELVMMGAVFGQHDTVVGSYCAAVAVIAALTVVGFGLVLLTAGSTEWEVRSEFARGSSSATGGRSRARTP